MPVTYTNRKGVTYLLCRSLTATGKPRYYFAREPKGELVEAVPEGFKICETVNGLAYLAPDRREEILPAEVAAVEAAVKRHRKADHFRVSVKGKRIVIHERVGPDTDELLSILKASGFPVPGSAADRLRDSQDRQARFSPVLRFTLIDAEKRIFGVERVDFRRTTDTWLDLSPTGPVDRLARQLIPKLGTDALFEVF